MAHYNRRLLSSVFLEGPNERITRQIKFLDGQIWAYAESIGLSFKSCSVPAIL
jgi:hypothetical protein